jgi:GNAT superfamily N-acetyltransferase
MMTAADLDFAASCTEVAGWGAQRGEFQGLYAHDPQGCFVAEGRGRGDRDERRIGICIATSYGDVGFLGMLVVVPEARGRGIGRCLLDRAIGYLHSRGVRTIGLDGVQAAVPLYERLGFRKRCPSLRFRGTPQGQMHSRVRPMRTADLGAVCVLDWRAFGADRGFFLRRRFAQESALCKVLEQDGRIGGFILGRCSGKSITGGPWVVRPEVERPADLVEAVALEAEGTTISLGILESNAPAIEAARALGLTARDDSPWRMTLGPDALDVLSDVLGASPMAYAVGSPAKG